MIFVYLFIYIYIFSFQRKETKIKQMIALLSQDGTLLFSPSYLNFFYNQPKFCVYRYIRKIIKYENEIKIEFLFHPHGIHKALKSFAKSFYISRVRCDAGHKKLLHIAKEIKIIKDEVYRRQVNSPLFFPCANYRSIKIYSLESAHVW